MLERNDGPTPLSAETIALVCGHVTAAGGLLAYSALSGVLAPIPAIGAIWLLLLARGLLRPNARLLQLVRVTHAVGLLTGVLMAVYGIFTLQSGVARTPPPAPLVTAAHWLPVILGVLLTVLAAAALYASRPPLFGARMH